MFLPNKNTNNSRELRSLDVVTTKTFEQLLIHPEIINRLKQHNEFKAPTPVQAGAIPLGLLGNDLLVQAKSGTGKTLVFAILVANVIMETRTNECVAVILAPVREIAYQIKDTIDKVVPQKTRVGVFIGGEDVKTNKEMISRGCSVAIGTPGRMAQLVRLGLLSLKESKIFVLDEADKLMDSTYREDIDLVYKSLNPETTQVAAFSATYPNELDIYLSQFMKSPAGLRLDSKDVQLLTIYQYAIIAIGKDPIKVAVDELMNYLMFSQVIVFSNSSEACPEICEYFSSKDYRAKSISSDFSQEERNKVVHELKNYSIRVMVSTDVTARGIDAPNVNVVINIGVPGDLETYLHRIGRAGRYGGNGAAFTILTSHSDVAKFYRFTKAGNLHVKLLDVTKEFPFDLYENSKFHNNAKEFGKIIKTEKIENLVPSKNTKTEKFVNVEKEKKISQNSESKIYSLENSESLSKTQQVLRETKNENLSNKDASNSKDKIDESLPSTLIFCDNSEAKHISSLEKMNALKTKTFGKTFAGSSNQNVFKKPSQSSSTKTESNEVESQKFGLLSKNNIISETSPKFSSVSKSNNNSEVNSSLFGHQDNINALKTKSFGKTFGGSSNLNVFNKPSPFSTKPPQSNSVNLIMQDSKLSESEELPINTSAAVTEIFSNLETNFICSKEMDNPDPSFFTNKMETLAIHETTFKNISVSPPKLIISYSREELYEIKNSKTDQEWKNFLKTKKDCWDIKDSPFELDDELRGIPFNQQIRIIRDREMVSLRKRQEELQIIKPKINKTTEIEGNIIYPSGIIGNTEANLHKENEFSIPLDENVFNQQIIDFLKNFENKTAPDIFGPMVFPRASSSTSNTNQIIEQLEIQDKIMAEIYGQQKPQTIASKLEENLLRVKNNETNNLDEIMKEENSDDDPETLSLNIEENPNQNVTNPPIKNNENSSFSFYDNYAKNLFSKIL